MYKLPFGKSKDDISPLQRILDFMKMGEYAFGFPDVARYPLLNKSTESVHSAYEMNENPNEETVFEAETSDYMTPDSLELSISSSDVPSTSSSCYNVPSPKNQNRSFSQVKLANFKQSTSTTSVSPKSKMSVSDQKDTQTLKSTSFDNSEIAQVVHDIVFEKYEESYIRLLSKLKKFHLTEEENRFRNVVSELESVFKARNKNKQNIGCGSDTYSCLETELVDSEYVENGAGNINIQQTKMFPTPVYSSTDSELELEIKHIGIPEHGKLNKSFTKSNSNTAKLPLKECDAESIDYSVKTLHKYLSDPQITERSLPCRFINVEAQVYACSIEDNPADNNFENKDVVTTPKHQEALGKRKTYNKSFGTQESSTNLDQVESVAINSLESTPQSLYYSTHQSVPEYDEPRTPQSLYYSLRQTEPEYDEQNFLRTALGDELLENYSSTEYIFPPTVSVATEDISDLMSSTSTIAQAQNRRNRALKTNKILSNTYSKKSASLSSVVTRKATGGNHKSMTLDSGVYPSYEQITNFNEAISSNKDKKLIKNKIFVHESIIDQAEKALEYGRRKSRGFIGSPAHLEAERTLLVSKIRRQVLINTLYTISEAPSETTGRITITNLRCTLNTIKTNPAQSPEQYYVCILQHKTTVYSTRIAAPNKLDWVDFGGCFIFDNVSNTFDIKIELHAIQLPETSQKCVVFPFLCSPIKLPMMKHIGETHIGIINRKNEKFALTCCNGEKLIEHKLTASIETSIKWPDTLRGFLTIGIETPDHPPFWNRRWCVLEDGQLHYYNYPSDENYCKPVGTLDLDSCKCCDETEKRYIRQRTLALFVDSDSEFKMYYISPDSTEEFNLWHKNLNLVLKLIKEWNMF